MYDDCYKYKEKKGSVRKKKNNNKEKHNCYEDEKKKPKYPKCSKSRRQPVPINHLNETQTILLRIQPTIADRERYLNPHINCVREELEEPCSKKSKEKPYLLQLSKSKSKPFISAKGRKGKEANENDKMQIEEKKKSKVKIQNNSTDERQKQKENTQQTEVSRDKQQNAVFESAQEDNDTKKHDGISKRKSKYQKVKRTKKPQLEQHRTDKDSDSEMIICSDDSEISLVDISLTKEDKNRIEENRRRLRPLTDDKGNESDKVTNEGRKKVTGTKGPKEKMSEDTNGPVKMPDEEKEREGAKETAKDE